MLPDKKLTAMPILLLQRTIQLKYNNALALVSKQQVCQIKEQHAEIKRFSNQTNHKNKETV